jgi:hypothetical protein
MNCDDAFDGVFIGLPTGRIGPVFTIGLAVLMVCRRATTADLAEELTVTGVTMAAASSTSR